MYKCMPLSKWEVTSWLEDKLGNHQRLGINSSSESDGKIGFFNVQEQDHSDAILLVSQFAAVQSNCCGQWQQRRGTAAPRHYLAEAMRRGSGHIVALCVIVVSSVNVLVKSEWMLFPKAEFLCPEVEESPRGTCLLGFLLRS